MREDFPLQKAEEAIVDMLHDYLAEKEHAERLTSENAILMRKTADLMDELERLKTEQKLKAFPVEAKLFDRVAELKAEVERLTKAGDAMISEWASGDEKDAKNFLKALAIWNAAKEGKPRA